MFCHLGRPLLYSNGKSLKLLNKLFGVKKVIFNNEKATILMTNKFMLHFYDNFIILIRVLVFHIIKIARRNPYSIKFEINIIYVTLAGSNF